MQHKKTFKPLNNNKDQIQKDSVDNFVKFQEMNELKQKQEKLNQMKDIQNQNLNKPNQYKSRIFSIKQQPDESKWLFESEYKN